MNIGIVYFSEVHIDENLFVSLYLYQGHNENRMWGSLALLGFGSHVLGRN